MGVAGPRVQPCPQGSIFPAPTPLPQSVLALFSGGSATFLEREALVPTGSGRRVLGEGPTGPGLAPMLSPEPSTEATGMGYLAWASRLPLESGSAKNRGIPTGHVLKLEEL